MANAERWAASACQGSPQPARLKQLTEHVTNVLFRFFFLSLSLSPCVCVCVDRFIF